MDLTGFGAQPESPEVGHLRQVIPHSHYCLFLLRGKDDGGCGAGGHGVEVGRAKSLCGEQEGGRGCLWPTSCELCPSSSVES